MIDTIAPSTLELRTFVVQQVGSTSLIVCNENPGFVRRDRGTYAVATNPHSLLLAHNPIANDSRVFNGSLAISNGPLLLRSDRTLYCVGKTR